MHFCILCFSLVFYFFLFFVFLHYLTMLISKGKKLLWSIRLQGHIRKKGEWGRGRQGRHPQAGSAWEVKNGTLFLKAPGRVLDNAACVPTWILQ